MELLELIQKYVQELVNHDEVDRALLVLDNVPAHLRDRPPKELTELRTNIMASLCTPSVYLEDERDSEVDINKAKAFLDTFLRGILIKKELEKKDLHIIDMGPGNYSVPLGLSHYPELKFSYQPLAMNNPAKSKAFFFIEPYLEENTKDKPVLFIANEVIEHLPNPSDIAVNALAFAKKRPEYIHVSTPLYCYDPCPKKYAKGSLPHLRAYTPDELHKEMLKMFPGYFWQLYESPIMSIRGIRSDIEDKSPLLNNEPT
jgi:hypothetical protein